MHYSLPFPYCTLHSSWSFLSVPPHPLGSLLPTHFTSRRCGRGLAVVIVYSPRVRLKRPRCAVTTHIATCVAHSPTLNSPPPLLLPYPHRHHPMCYSSSVLFLVTLLVSFLPPPPAVLAYVAYYCSWVCSHSLLLRAANVPVSLHFIVYLACTQPPLSKLDML